jgi:hypothetical protein
MRIFGIIMLTLLGVMLSIVSVNGGFQGFNLVGFNGVSFLLNILILFVGVGTGSLLMNDINQLYLKYYNAYHKLRDEHEKLTLQKDELRLDAIVHFDKIHQELLEVTEELKRIKNEQR